MVTASLPPNFTGLFVPGATAPPDHCSPTYTPSSVSGCVPNTFENRSLPSRPHSSGITISRNV
jgi:hypothetical protein